MKRYKKPSELKVGVVGYGGAFNMGRSHLREMEKAGMTPTAVAEIDSERLKVASTDFPGIETYASVEELLRKSAVDLVTMITPHNTHAQLALQCLRAGRHIVTEKPMAITTAECDAMIREGKKRGLMVSTYHNRHWDGWIMQALETIAKGTIGEVFRIQARMGTYKNPGEWWRASKSISGGVLYDWGIHLLEYALQIIQAEIVEVSGFAHRGFWAPQTKWKKDTNEDDGFAVVRFANGAWLTLGITNLDANLSPVWFEITGTKGTYWFNTNQFSVVQQQEDRKVTIQGPVAKSETWRYYQNVADHLVLGKPLVITGEWSRRPIHILDLACKSAEAGRALRAKYR